MKLTKENKAYIDGLSFEELFRHWRFDIPGSEWFQEETGEYWGKRLSEFRSDKAKWTEMSKKIGW